MAPIWGGAFALAACTGEGVGGDDQRVVRRDSAGVPIVENVLAVADTLELTRPVLIIGDGESVAQAVFQQVQSVAALPDGRIVVVDVEPRIVLFDSTGAWVRDIARKGGGPGEYRVPTWVLVQGDTVVVWDVARRRLLRHTPDGIPLADILISTRAAGLPMRPLGGGWIDEGEIGQDPDTARAAAFLVRRGADGTLLDTLLAPYPVPQIGWQIDAATQTGQMVNPPLFSPRPVWTTSGARIAWSSGDRGVVDFHSADDGTLEARVILPRSRRPTDHEAIERHFRALGDRFSIPAERLAEGGAGAVAADSLPVIAALVAAEDGSVWVAEHDPGALFVGVSSRWDVIDAGGVLRRRVHFPTGFTLHAVVGGRAYGVATGGSGESLVHVYDLVAQPAGRER